MTMAQPERSALTDLISSLDHLAILGRELRDDNTETRQVVIAEVDELLSEARRAVDQLTALSVASGGPPGAGRFGGIDPLSIAYTVGITTVILPFVQGMVQRAGEDAYRGITGLIRRRRHAQLPVGEPTSVVLDDRETKTQVVIDSRVDDAAIAMLRRLDFTDDRLRAATLRWNPDRQTWEALPGRPEVNLWLPGDPLDGDW